MSLSDTKYPALALPQTELRLDTQGDRPKVFDPRRKKWLVLTPEEWVRQHLLQFLVVDKGYPLALLRTEGGQAVNGMKRRFDILAYDQDGKPLMLVECKAPSVKITQQVFEQVSAYNLAQKAPYLVVSNGLQHFCCAIDFEKKAYTWLSEIPAFERSSLGKV